MCNATVVNILQLVYLTIDEIGFLFYMLQYII